MSLQTTTPASQEMVIFQMMSVRTEIRPTHRSAAARFLMKKFIRDFRPLGSVCAKCKGRGQQGWKVGVLIVP